MGFEKTVLNKVAKILGQDGLASFTQGTLFVRAPEADARRVFSMLFRDYNQQVHVSMVGYEYAYDFVA